MPTLLPNIFSSYKINNLTLPNRIIMSPMTRMVSNDKNYPDKDFNSYYRRRIEGGVGLIISSASFINHPSANGYPNMPAFYGAALDGWRNIVTEVHTAGGYIFSQLWHAGPVRTPEIEPHSGIPGSGPSSIVKEGKVITKKLSSTDMHDIIFAYVQAAKDAQSLGFDGIEIHGAHGFLLDHFFWKKSNTRVDEYGGSVNNRGRFACEVISAIRAAVGIEFPISFRFSQWKQDDYNAKIVDNPDELEVLLSALVEAGVDIFHPSTRRFWEPAFEGSDLSLAGWTKNITNKTTIAVGSIGIDHEYIINHFVGEEPFETKPVIIDEVEKRLSDGEFDLIAVGRAILADAAWPQKILNGELKNIQPFTSESLIQERSSL